MHVIPGAAEVARSGIVLGLSLKRKARFSPRGPRSAVNIDTYLVLSDDRLVPITIRNLSPKGFMGETEAVLPPDTWIGVELPGRGILRARVRWTEAGELGCKFRTPTDAKASQSRSIEGSGPTGP